MRLEPDPVLLWAQALTEHCFQYHVPHGMAPATELSYGKRKEVKYDQVIIIKAQLGVKQLIA